MTKSIITGVLAYFSMLGPCFAHPGHGVGTPERLWHYITSPMHASPFALLALVLGAIWFVRRGQSRSGE